MGSPWQKQGSCISLAEISLGNRPRWRLYCTEQGSDREALPAWRVNPPINHCNSRPRSMQALMSCVSGCMTGSTCVSGSRRPTPSNSGAAKRPRLCRTSAAFGRRLGPEATATIMLWSNLVCFICLRPARAMDTSRGGLARPRPSKWVAGCSDQPSPAQDRHLCNLFPLPRTTARGLHHRPLALVSS